MSEPIDRSNRISQASIPAAIRRTASVWLARRDDGLSEAEQAEFDAWRQADPRHEVAALRLERSWELLGRPKNAGAASKMLHDLSRLARVRRLRRTGVIAMAVGILLTIGLVRRLPSTSPKAGQETSAVAVVAPFRETLLDGSVVELRAGSKIAVDFSATQRRVMLRHGEAHFQVAKDPQRPFVVSAAGVEVQAIGTEFSVNLHGMSVTVLVAEGRVSLDRSADSAAGASISEGTSTPDAAKPAFLVAGERAIISFDAEHFSPAIESVPATEISAQLAWRKPRLEFTNITLEAAVRLMNEHNAVRMVIGDSSLASERVSGLFGADNVDAFIHVLEHSFPIRAEWRGKSEVILRRAL